MYRLLYHQFAWAYDWVASFVSAGKWQGWVKLVLPHLRGRCILEVGYGPGHLQEALLNQNLSAYGLDASPQMARIAHRRLQCANFQNRLIIARAERMPYPSDYFDCIAATFPSEYIFHTSTAHEIARVLKPGGLLVILPQAKATMWPINPSFATRLARFYEKTIEFQYSMRDRLIETYTQAGLFTQSSEVVHSDTEILLIFALKPEKYSPNSL